LILKTCDKDYEERDDVRDDRYAVPHRGGRWRYHCDTTKHAHDVSLASRKNDMTVYLMSVTDRDGGEWFQKAGQDGEEAEHGAGVASNFKGRSKRRAGC